jgi:hypothetical protein
MAAKLVASLVVGTVEEKALLMVEQMVARMVDGMVGKLAV